MLLTGTLTPHLEETERQAEELFSQLVLDLSRREGAPEQLKASDQMAWAGHMNSIRHQAEETVRKELICV